jgi:hypothetical protein
MVPQPSASALVRWDLGPDGGVGVVELVAGADDVGLGERRDEHRDVAGPDLVGGAELLQRGEEPLTGVEPEPERPAGDELMAVHRGVLLSPV